MHVLFLDYDCIDYDTLIDELCALTEEFELGNLHIFKLDRENAFHVVCLDHFLLHDVKVIAQSSSCDLGFVIAPRYDMFRNWVLRDAVKGKRTKPKYFEILKSPYEGIRKQSSAHALFIKQYYGIEIPLKNPDNNTIVKLESYLTAKRVS